MAHPLLTPVTSSMVEAYKYFKIGDEIDDQWSLFVEFKPGKIYRYIVPFDLCQQMDSASSFGKFVNQMKQDCRSPILMSDQDVTDMIQLAASAAPNKPRKRRKQVLPPAFCAQYPVLNHFF